MPKAIPAEEVLPDPSRVIEGLRDTGYQFHTAIADIIDNSISANASIVDIKMDIDYEGNISVSIADDGCGMSRGDLIDAMRYGSRKRTDPASLGKFGLGLKTASTAFCRKLSVISRSSGSKPFCKATWDIDYVARVGKWHLLLPEPEEAELVHVKSVCGKGSGTVVLWESIDRLLKNYAEPGGAFARKALDKQIQTLSEHLSMVYQRFLDKKSSKAKYIEIIINGDKIKPWDPFCKSESKLIAEKDQVVEINGSTKAKFTVKAYVLPRKEEFDDPEAAKAANISNTMQGIYIYRENRLIHGPDWMGMYQKEPHYSLSRIEFSFDHKLDDAFHIDIKKSQIILNEDLYNWLYSEFLPVPRRAAEQAYRRGLKKKVNDISKGTHDSSNTSIHDKAADLGTAKITNVDPDKNEADITNKHGKIRIKISVGKPTKPGEFHVQPVASIDDGLLWEPCVIEKNQAFRVNTGHPYYHKVYFPNRINGITIQGLDSFIWALCAAEMGAVSSPTQKHFEELRYEVSRLLRLLVEDLPEPEVGGE